MLAYVATQLLEAQRNAQARGQAVMQFTECEIECAVQVEKETGGGLKVWILELTGGKKKTEQNTITVRFSAIEGQPPVQTLTR